MGYRLQLKSLFRGNTSWWKCKLTSTSGASVLDRTKGSKILGWECGMFCKQQVSWYGDWNRERQGDVRQEKRYDLIMEGLVGHQNDLDFYSS